MSDSFKIQQNVKVGNDLINLRADSSQEFESIANWVIANAALFVNVQTVLTSVPPALAANVINTQVVQEPYNGPNPQQQAQQENPGWGAPQGTPPPSFAQPATQVPTCQHGPMVYRASKPGAEKQWTAHFCPTPQGTPGQCKPIFGK